MCNKEGWNGETGLVFYFQCSMILGCMRFLVVFLFVLFGMLFAVSGKTMFLPVEGMPYPEYPATGRDTLQFPIRESADNEIRRNVPPSSLFLKKPSNVRDTVVYDPTTKRYVVMTLIGDKYE